MSDKDGQAPLGPDRLARALCWQSLHISSRPEDGRTLDRAGLPPGLGAWKEPGQSIEWLIGYVSMAREDCPPRRGGGM